jgi:hypothetical protein
MSAAKRLRAGVKAFTPSALHPGAFAERYLRRLQRDDRIAAGPFAGMRFTWDPWDPYFSLPLAKFLGTYELELHPVIERIAAVRFDLIVDVGAAEGYYAIGLARRCRSARVLAFEELAAGREVMARLAETNGVADRLEVAARCEPSDLNDALIRARNVLVLMDVEGYEQVLLDPEAVPGLRRARILFEAHDCYVPGVGEEICRRFEATHDIEAISYRARTLDDMHTVGPWLKLYAKYNLTGWLGERLYPVTWFYLEPRI